MYCDRFLFLFPSSAVLIPFPLLSHSPPVVFSFHFSVITKDRSKYPSITYIAGSSNVCFLCSYLPPNTRSVKSPNPLHTIQTFLSYFVCSSTSPSFCHSLIFFFSTCFTFLDEESSYLLLFLIA